MSIKSNEYRIFLCDIIAKRASHSACCWLNSILQTAASLPLSDQFGAIYARAARILGSAPVYPDENERAVLASNDLPWIGGRPLHELGRMVLLLHATEILTPEVATESIEGLYMQGDAAERQALLRTLPLLPTPNNFLSTAVEACRSNLHTVFEAIACENPYPSRYFPAANFNQMVMKSISLGVPLQRIVGLRARVSPPLTGMARDYVHEQIASGRPIHKDIHILTNQE